jgi:hypothetical protein
LEPDEQIHCHYCGRREEEANHFLSNLIPEILHTYGPNAGKWFTAQGLTVYQNVKWNPTEGTTTLTNAKASTQRPMEDHC